jgi:hypothetical protein
MTAVLGLFDKKSFRSFKLLSDLQEQFGHIPFLILFDDPTDTSDAAESDIINLIEIKLETIIDFISREFFVKPNLLLSLCDKYKPFLKILLSIYARKEYRFDYIVMTDNDIFFFEPITEISILFKDNTPFLIPEIGKNDFIPIIGEYLTSLLGLTIRYESPKKGMGYNVGLMGFDLTLMDKIDDHVKLLRLVEIINGCKEWHTEQAFMVGMNFCTNKNVFTFSDHKYFFYLHNYNFFLYKRNSKIFHCIGTNDKKKVDLMYSIRFKNFKSKIFAFLKISFFILIDLSKIIINTVLIHLNDISKGLKLFEFKTKNGVFLNADRYKYLIDWVSNNYCDNILEIGVWRGDTSEALLKSSLNPKVKYHGVDLFEESNEMIIRMESSLKANTTDIVKKRLENISKNVVLYKGYSKEIFPFLEKSDLKFDLIFIDGGHSYETVKEDFFQYSRLLSSKGAIFLDDYTEEPSLLGVKHFVDKHLLIDDLYVVKILDGRIDKYRGYEYKMVLVKKRLVA